MKIKKSINEATIDDAVNQAEKDLEQPEVATTKGQIETTLDRALKVNLRELKRGGRNFSNVLLVGTAGTGKTSRVKAWAQENGINLVTVLASSMDDTDLGGVISKSDDGETVKRLATTELDELEQPNSVLFLDEYNRAPSTVRGTLLTLIQDHTVRDDRVKGKQRFLKNFLFTIAAMNPDNGQYDVQPLDDAERSRFRRVDIYSDPSNTAQYLVGLFTKRAQEADDDPEEKQEYLGKASLAKALLGSKIFKFDDEQDIAAAKQQMGDDTNVLTARTLTNLLQYCDGTKDDFLGNWNYYCNPMKKSMAERILANYQDVDDKANDALKGGSSNKMFGGEEENVFAQKKQTNADKLRAARAKLGA